MVPKGDSLDALGRVPRVFAVLLAATLVYRPVPLERV
jgi:hypothetical protein